jgi:nucleotide-binding universal stress UspA family protein
MRLPVKNILCASDLSPIGDGAVDLAYALAGPGATVHLLHVNEPAFVMSPLDATVLYTSPGSEERQKEVDERAARHLKRLIPEDALTRGVRTEVHVLHESGPAGVIEREATARKVDLIVLGTHGRSGIAKALLGSVADSVMRHAKVPVALFHDRPK